MSLPESIVLPQTREAETIRRYALGQADPSYFDKDAAPIFADNMVFNGLLFKVAGGENVRGLFATFVKDIIVEVKFDSIVECGSKDKYLFLYFLRLQGMGENGLYICDYTTLDESGLMVRMENCYDTSKCPQEFINAGAQATAQAKEIFKQLNGS